MLLNKVASIVMEVGFGSPCPTAPIFITMEVFFMISATLVRSPEEDLFGMKLRNILSNIQGKEMQGEIVDIKYQISDYNQLRYTALIIYKTKTTD